MQQTVLTKLLTFCHYISYRFFFFAKQGPFILKVVFLSTFIFLALFVFHYYAPCSLSLSTVHLSPPQSLFTLPMSLVLWGQLWLHLFAVTGKKFSCVLPRSTIISSNLYLYIWFVCPILYFLRA